MPGLSLLQTRAILLMQEYAAAGQTPTYEELARLLKCRRQNFSEWQQAPVWNAAVVACFRSVSGALWARGEAAVANKVARGDAASFWNYVDRGGPVSWAPTGIDAAQLSGPGGFQNQHQGPRVEVHVHGIPERQPLSSAPPPLSLPAAPAPGAPK